MSGVFYAEADIQQFDIWRYRIYGSRLKDQPQLNTFYDLILPGPKQTYRLGGLGFDWYQPVHENGNILSYPALVGAPRIPDDIQELTLLKDGKPAGTLKEPPRLRECVCVRWHGGHSRT